MSAPDQRLELAQLQTLVVHGYAHDHCRYFIFTIEERAAARRFLARLKADRWIEPANHRSHGHPRHPTPISVALTYRGLQVLGLRKPFLHVLQRRATAFYEGPQPRAASRLADTGQSAPRYWDPRFDRDAAHVLLAVHGDDPSRLADAQAELMRLAGTAFAAAGWEAPFETSHLKQQSADITRRKVHFGFVDGISKVLIQGVPQHDALDPGHKKAHAPGEFVLGYANDKGYNPWLLPDEPPDTGVQPPGPGEVRTPPVWRPADFFRNGSFAALRDMAQHEAAFRGYTEARAGQLGVDPVYLQAKMLGRWPEGGVVKPGHEVAPEPGGDGLDDFDFSDDPQGQGCPFGAHVRRMNPRADGIVPFRRRPLIRRGMPYGPAWEKGEEDGARPRGLIGLFICASLEEQFEHLVSEWGDASPMGTPNKGNAKDPLIGNHVNAAAFFDIPMATEQLRRLDGLRPFVTTRGTVYLFFPGLAVLQNLHNANVFDQ
ncbi:MAG: Dyp-type peroxidase family [Rhodoferax sp.]|nr:Dyp-type peroxidase family [Rhodoferax sp.]